MDCNNDPRNATLLALDGEHGKVLAISMDGLVITTIVEHCGGTPDGIVANPSNRHIYWTHPWRTSVQQLPCYSSFNHLPFSFFNHPPFKSKK